MFGVQFFKKSGVAFVGGFVDRFSSRLTGKKICIGKAVLVKMGECEPWSDHIDINVIPKINESLSNKDFNSARGFVEFGSMLSEGKKHKTFCVSLLLEAIDLVAKGEELLISATPFYYVD